MHRGVKVDEAEASVDAHHILGLHIPVQQPVLVQVVHGGGQLAQQDPGLVDAGAFRGVDLLQVAVRGAQDESEAERLAVEPLLRDGLSSGVAAILVVQVALDAQHELVAQHVLGDGAH